MKALTATVEGKQTCAKKNTKTEGRTNKDSMYNCVCFKVSDISKHTVQTFVQAHQFILIEWECSNFSLCTIFILCIFTHQLSDKILRVA